MIKQYLKKMILQTEIGKTILEKRKLNIKKRKGLILDGDLCIDLRHRLSFDGRICIFDVGANLGQSVIPFRKAFPYSDIYCFEPVASSFGSLFNSVKNDKRIFCHQLALGHKQGFCDIQSRGLSSGNQIIENRDNRDSIDMSFESVEMTTGADFCIRSKISKINFLKIDTEGYDLNVLLGFQPMLETQKIDVLQVEAGMNNTNKRHVAFAEFINFLEPLQYRLFHIYEQVMETHGRPILRRTNPVFISQVYAEKNRWEI